MNIKKFLLTALLLTAVISSGCASKAEEIRLIIDGAVYELELPEETKDIKLGVVPGPYGDMFSETVLPLLALKGYTVELVFYDDFVQPNLALGNYEVDLNMFQHYRYLNDFKFTHDLDLSAIAEIPTVSMAVFSEKYASLEDIEEGAVALIPNDATNLARALRVLEAANVIALEPYSDKSRATEDDIVRNPKNITFKTAEANQLVAELPENDLAVINGNFAYAGGLNIAAALYSEVLQEGYINVIAVRTEDLSRRFVRDILDVIHSDDFKNAIINSNYGGFQRPRYFY